MKIVLAEQTMFKWFDHKSEEFTSVVYFMQRNLINNLSTQLIVMQKSFSL